jgi:hypothetical protein
MTCFDACLNRLNFQLEKAKKFFVFTFKTIQATGDEDIIHLFNVFFIIKMFSIYEEYIRSLIFHGGILKEREMIDYFNQNDKDKKHQINDLKDLVRKLHTIGLHGDKCKRLKTIFKIIFDFDFFPESKTEKLFLDFILLRNIIVHDGGSIESRQVEQLYYTNVVEKTSNLPKPFDFYRLRIYKSKFNVEITEALKNLSIHIQSNLKQLENRKRNPRPDL